MSSISFEQQVTLTYLAANLRDGSVTLKENEHLTGRPAPRIDREDLSEWLAWCAEAEGRRCAAQAEAFPKGVKAHEAKAWDGV